MKTEYGGTFATGEAESDTVAGESRSLLGGGTNPQMSKAKAEQLTRREQLEAWRASRPPTQKKPLAKCAGYKSDFANSSVGSTTSAWSVPSEVVSRVNCRLSPKVAVERMKTLKTTDPKTPNAGAAGVAEAVPRTPKARHTRSPVSRPASGSQQATAAASTRSTKPDRSVHAKAGPAGALPSARPRAVLARSLTMHSGLEVLKVDKLDGVSDRDGVLDLAMEHSVCSAPPPSPCTPYARRLPAKSLDRNVLAEVLQETFNGVAAAWHAPKRLEVFIGNSPGWEEALSPPKTDKENLRPIGSNGNRKLHSDTVEIEGAATEVGNEKSQDLFTPRMNFTEGWIKQSRNKRPSLSDWYTDVPHAQEAL